MQPQPPSSTEEDGQNITFSEDLKKKIKVDAEKVHADPHSEELAEKERKRIVQDGLHESKYKDHIYWIVCSGMYLGGLCLLAMLIVAVWHLLAPENVKWLTDNQVQNIERLLFSGAIISLSGRYFKRYKIFGDKE